MKPSKWFRDQDESFFSGNEMMGYGNDDAERIVGFTLQ
jgi:hypothetical protein